ncbi:MAG: hypothetical protein AAGD11_05060 [Planctomycetota bacterium]
MPSVHGIAQAASAIQTSQTHTQIQTAVAKKQLEAVKQQGNAAVQLIQQVADANTRLDVRA